MVYYFSWSVYVKSSLHPWDETNFITVNDPFNVLLNIVYKYWINEFYIYVHQGYWAIVLFLLLCLNPVLISACNCHLYDWDKVSAKYAEYSTVSVIYNLKEKIIEILTQFQSLASSLASFKSKNPVAERITQRKWMNQRGKS